MTEDNRDKYISELCESCNGHGVIWGDRYRGDEECSECDGEGMIWRVRKMSKGRAIT